MKKLLFLFLLTACSAFAQKINLTNQVTKILPIANGGTGNANGSATQLLGGTWAVPGAIGSTTANTGVFSGLTLTNVASGTQCLHANSSGVVSGTGADCGAGGGGLSGLTATFIPKATNATTVANSLLTDDGTVLTYSGSGGVSFTGAGGGAWKPLEGTCPAGAATFDLLCADSTLHRLLMKNNNGSALQVGGIVASGSTALGTSSIPANSCATVVTASATNTLTTDRIGFTPTVSIKAVTGYTPAGTLSIVAYPTANNVNFDVCNKDQTNAVIPGAVTVNWEVTR